MTAFHTISIPHDDIPQGRLTMDGFLTGRGWTQEDIRFALQKRIQALDTEMDAYVYCLYGLTEEEIKIVEGNR